MTLIDELSGHRSTGIYRRDGDTEQTVAEAIERGGLRDVEVMWLDHQGHARGKRIEAASFLSALAGRGSRSAPPPGTYADFAECIIPELQRRGVYRTAYDPGTLREKLLGRGPRLPVSHPGSRFRALAQDQLRPLPGEIVQWFGRLCLAGSGES